MGTWGSGNFENDDAEDYVLEVISKFTKKNEDIINSEDESDIFELGEGVLMPNVEFITLIIENSNGFGWIDKAIVRKWKEKYLAIFDSQINGYAPKEGYKEERIKIIKDTFEKLESLGIEKNILDYETILKSAKDF